MRMLRAWLLRLAGAFRRRRGERELHEEIQSHLQLHIDDNVRAGMTPAEARRAALIRFGGIEAAKEDYRERWSLRQLDHLAQDLRHAVRLLRSGTSVTAVAMLALAIGLTTAMFAVTDALVLRPVPFRDPDRLAQLFMGSEHGGSLDVAPTVLRAWRAIPAFEAVEAATPGSAVLDGDGQPVVTATALVTPGLFDMLGVRPVRGRVAQPEEARGAQGEQIEISENLWRRAFAASPDVIGRRVSLDGESVVIVGILPAGFHFPAWETEVWRPIDFDSPTAGDHRPVPFVRLAAALSEGDALRLATEAAHGVDGSTANLGARRYPIAGYAMNTYYKAALSMLSVGVGFVFLTLCANVTGLLLARFNARRREFTLCFALGASRGRLLMRALVESALLAATGACGGLMLASGLVLVARALLPEQFLAHTLTPLQIDSRAVFVAVTLGAIATIVAGLLPAWIATRPRPATPLSATERSSTDSRSARMFTRALLVVEIAFACSLLVGATVLVRSFINLARIDRGFDPHGKLVVRISFEGRARSDSDVRLASVRAVEDEVAHLPGVQEVVWSRGGPLTSSNNLYFYDWLPDTTGANPLRIPVESAAVGPEFFHMYGMTLLRGRTFRPGDSRNDIVIGERLASALWPGIDPIDHTLRGGTMTFHVIGVVKEVRRAVIDQPLRQIYEPFTPGRGTTITLRCEASCPSEGVIRQRLLAVGSGVRVFGVQSMETTYLADLEQPRATAALGMTFASVALVAAAGGLFSVLNYAVSRRRREFGIRFALGASATAIRRLVMRDGLVVVSLGVVIGGAAAWALGRTLASLQYDVTAADPGTWAIVLSLLSAAGLLASWRPARAAAQIDPVALLREE